MPDFLALADNRLGIQSGCQEYHLRHRTKVAPPTYYLVFSKCKQLILDQFSFNLDQAAYVFICAEIHRLGVLYPLSTSLILDAAIQDSWQHLPSIEIE